MLAKTYCYGLDGLSAYPITVEVDTSRGLPSTNIVGLPDSAIKESKDRVRTALNNSGFKYAKGRVTINLSPAYIKKEGASFDLAIAIGILAATEQIGSQHLRDYVLLGELSLDGALQSIRGSLSVAIASYKNYKGIILPSENAEEANLAKTIDIFPVKTLTDVVSLLNAPSEHIAYTSKNTKPVSEDPYDIDFKDVKGQQNVKRGLEIAAAGQHNFLLIGPPGSGKSMLAKRFNTILPNMSHQESLETTQIHSVAGLLTSKNTIITQRPFRSPHHTSSSIAIIGGGSNPRPGEVTLAHNGVLFLDEFPEFKRDSLENLRQPLEDNEVTISRVNKSTKFPAKFILACAMNPTPRGWLNNNEASHYQMQKYLSKLSGPLLDRIDLHLDVPAVKCDDLFSSSYGESSKEIKQRTNVAFAIQKERFQNTNIVSNAYMGQKEIKQFCHLDTESLSLLKEAIKELNMSARGYDKILKISRTIADLDQKDTIQTHHIAEAIGYRGLDRQSG